VLLYRTQLRSREFDNHNSFVTVEQPSATANTSSNETTLQYEVHARNSAKHPSIYLLKGSKSHLAIKSPTQGKIKKEKATSSVLVGGIPQRFEDRSLILLLQLSSPSRQFLIFIALPTFTFTFTLLPHSPFSKHLYCSLTPLDSNSLLNNPLVQAHALPHPNTNTSTFSFEDPQVYITINPNLFSTSYSVPTTFPP